jgi:ABC-2 type transport system permease protein
MNPVVNTKSLAMKRFHSPKTVIARFVARRSLRGAIAWAVVFGIYLASKAIGFVDSYPTAAARQKVVESFSSNIGIELLLGRAPQSVSTGAYVTWATLGIMVIIGSIWALLLATKFFRGEEDSGRWELALAGQTTPRGAAFNNLIGLGSSFLVFFVVIAALFSAIGRTKGLDFTLSSAVFLAVATSLGITMFLLVGALTSELMPTRSRAAFVATIVLGLSFVLRIIGDITSFHWVLNISPLGWVENLKPLSGSDSIWLIPIILSCLILGSLTIYFAGRRDLGASFFADKDSSAPKLRLLNSVFSFSARLSRGTNMSWLVALAAVSVLYGLMTKSAAQAFSQSEGAKHLLSKLVHEGQLSTVLTFLSLVLLIQMTVIMVYVANAIATLRREEADGLLENFLVRPYGRLRWLFGRIEQICLMVVMLGIITFIGLWVGTASQHTAISAQPLIDACLNALAPAVVTLGVGVLAYGFIPRLTSFFAYAVIGWSFLISLLSSGVHISHWILDTSVLNQIVLAPALNPNWAIDGILLLLGVILCVLGALRFNRRDLQSE